MKTLNKKIYHLLFLIALCAVAPSVYAAGAVHFKVKLGDSIGRNAQSFSGRLLIFMTAADKPLQTIEPQYDDPTAVYITGVEIENIAAGQTIEIDPDTLSFPAKFSDAKAGEYQLMALLDRDHSYNYDGIGAGDVISEVTKIKLPATDAELVLSKIIPEPTIEVPEGAKIVEFVSPMLSKFWGRPIKIEATVIVPPGYDGSKKLTYPTVYLVHGYGGSHLSQLRGATRLRNLMTEKKIPEMIYVALNAKFTLGHHVFADSVNNGPWGAALTREFIPYLEKQYKMDAKTTGRFLTGHSSGGWSTLWLQINYPDVFGGTWSTSPDPVDFHNFTGPDLTKTPAQNLYQNANGEDYNLVRDKGVNLASLKQYAEQERVTGAFGGQFASFEAVFSPKGIDGRPMPLFNRETGVIDPFVAKEWEKYDIAKILEANWKTLAPKLKGKIHIIVGTADTFHLDEGVRLLDAELKRLGSDAKIEYIEGRTHFDLYRGGLNERIANEMYAAARPQKK
ncbi:MAG: alpha/beta hydrolase-fold protein [Acidobacteriota bacterium]|nr:alpha/beta hydrolase-fold protein [Acidobacteriota bacterium]